MYSTKPAAPTWYDVLTVSMNPELSLTLRNTSSLLLNRVSAEVDEALTVMLGGHVTLGGYSSKDKSQRYEARQYKVTKEMKLSY